MQWLSDAFLGYLDEWDQSVKQKEFHRSREADDAPQQRNIRGAQDNRSILATIHTTC